jgi:hypothetical protein
MTAAASALFGVCADSRGNVNCQFARTNLELQMSAAFLSPNRRRSVPVVRGRPIFYARPVPQLTPVPMALIMARRA